MCVDKSLCARDDTYFRIQREIIILPEDLRKFYVPRVVDHEEKIVRASEDVMPGNLAVQIASI